MVCELHRANFTKLENLWPENLRKNNYILNTKIDKADWAFATFTTFTETLTKTIRRKKKMELALGP